MQLVSALFFWQNHPENEVGKKPNPISEKGNSLDDTDDDRIYIKIPSQAGANSLQTNDKFLSNETNDFYLILP